MNCPRSEPLRQRRVAGARLAVQDRVKPTERGESRHAGTDYLAMPSGGFDGMRIGKPALDLLDIRR